MSPFFLIFKKKLKGSNTVHFWNRLNENRSKMIFSVSVVCTEYCTSHTAYTESRQLQSNYISAVYMVYNNFGHQNFIQSVHFWNRLNAKRSKMIFSVSVVCTKYSAILLTQQIHSRAERARVQLTTILL